VHNEKQCRHRISTDLGMQIENSDEQSEKVPVSMRSSIEDGSKAGSERE
jgi:hypothetical protein